MQSIPLSPKTQDSQSDSNHILFTLPGDKEILNFSPWSLPTVHYCSKFFSRPTSIHTAAVSNLVSPILFSVTRERPLLGDHRCSFRSPLQHSSLLSWFFPKGNPNTSYCSAWHRSPLSQLRLQGRNASLTSPDN